MLSLQVVVGLKVVRTTLVMVGLLTSDIPCRSEPSVLVVDSRLRGMDCVSTDLTDGCRRLLTFVKRNVVRQTAYSRGVGVSVPIRSIMEIAVVVILAMTIT